MDLQQADMYFLPRTCRDKKWIASYFVLEDETQRGAILLSGMILLHPWHTDMEIFAKELVL